MRVSRGVQEHPCSFHKAKKNLLKWRPDAWEHLHGFRFTRGPAEFTLKLRSDLEGVRAGPLQT